MSIDEKTWHILAELNPAFQTGDEYPGHWDFFQAKSMVLHQSLVDFERDFSNMLFELQQNIDEIYSKLKKNQ